MNTETRSILTYALATADALFYPWRSRDHRGAIAAARGEYLACGIRWHSGIIGATGDAEARKAGERILSEGEEAGLWTTIATNGRRDHYRLTDRGESEARSLCDLPDFKATNAILARLHKLTAAAAFDAAMVSEISLLKKAPRPGASVQTMFEVELPIVAALVRGIVKSNCTGAGIAWFRVVRPDVLPTPATTQKCDGKLASQYYDLLRVVESRVKADDRTTSIGEIPLSNGINYASRSQHEHFTRQRRVD